MPKVSIIVPVYNVEPYIKDCLKSIKNQSFKDFEVLCIDDCGTDRSVEIIKEYINTDNRFKLIIHEKNKGLAAARNTGIKNANGEIIFFIDSDDWIETNTIELVYETFQKIDTEIIWFDANVIDAKIINHNKIFNPRLFLLNKGWIKITPTNINSFVDYAWNKAYKKSVFKNYNLYFTEGLYFEDSDFYLNCCLNIKKIYYINTPLYNYRHRENSIVTGNNAEQKKINDLFYVIEKWYDLLKEKNLINEYKMAVLDIFRKRAQIGMAQRNHEYSIQRIKQTLEYIGFPENYQDCI